MAIIYFARGLVGEEKEKEKAVSRIRSNWHKTAKPGGPGGGGREWWKQSTVRRTSSVV
jgi:hypothetical protein